MSKANLGAAREILRKVYGYDDFREGQDALVSAILQKRDVLGIMPTGSGKSLCYQVPAIALPGTAIVVSPLISLMHDQVRKLIERGVAAAYIDSTLTHPQIAAALARVGAGEFDIVYAAPERLNTRAFINAAIEANVALVAVDEAHCISQWGADFRPAYNAIADFVAHLPERPVIAAYTATATREVRRDIADRLELKRPKTVVTGFDRPNLSLKKRKVEKRARMREAVKYVLDHEGECGIVYCITRNDTEDVTRALELAGVNAVAYHAGMEAEERQKAQDLWIAGRAEVIVATTAFGMGIDKPDVRFVLNYAMSDSVEAYYQQAGRAGRDGLPSECMLFWSESDGSMWRFLFERGVEDAKEKPGYDPEMAEAAKAIKLRLLGEMEAYCKRKACMRDFILKYFGQKPEKATCGRCSCCIEQQERAKRISAKTRIDLGYMNEERAAWNNEKTMAKKREQQRKERLPKAMERVRVAERARKSNLSTSGKYPEGGIDLGNKSDH